MITLRSHRQGLLAGFWVVLACLEGRPHAARAEPSAVVQEADALFEQGLREMKAGDFASGCPRLAESYRLDPVPGALFTLAECEASWGRYATALEHYEAFVNQLPGIPSAKRKKYEERHRLALQKMAALGSITPQLVIDVAPTASADLVIKRDGEVIAPSTYGVAKSVDPGEYVVTAELDGRTLWRRRFRVAEADRVRAQVPEFPVPSPATEAPVQTVAGRKTRSGLRTAAYTTGALGVAVLGGGIAAGVVALRAKSTIDERCLGNVCDADGYSAASKSQRAARVSTIGFAVGGASVATAVVLWAWSRRQAARGRDTALTQVRLAPRIAVAGSAPSVGIQGAF